MVFFGFYCLLIGHLILKSTFLPRFLGVAMAFARLGWLTFVSPALVSSLSRRADRALAHSPYADPLYWASFTLLSLPQRAMPRFVRYTAPS